MNMFDEAGALQTMIAMCNTTQSEIAKKMGVSQSYVANKLRLLRFSDTVRRAIIDSCLTERHARTLLRIDKEEVLLGAISKAAERKMTVAECEAMVDVLVESRAPLQLLGTAGKRERIERFEAFISSSVASMKSMGIEVKVDRTFHLNKRYITLVIEE